MPLDAKNSALTVNDHSLGENEHGLFWVDIADIISEQKYDISKNLGTTESVDG